MESPTTSINSADEALYEMLGIDTLSLDAEVEPSTFDKETTVTVCMPPNSCHRPQTLHFPILLQTTSPLLTLHQCNHIIYLGNRSSNDGGRYYGPTYVTSAQNGLSGASVELQKPNHHKVCVFKDAIVLKWLKTAIHDHMDPFLQDWCLENNITSSNYRVNPRLRLLRYDARDHDIFLPHYDATTTCEDDGVLWESKLTILLYLNTGGGSHFSGGNTLFLNSLLHSDHLAIIPKRGHVVVFNHELYHASKELEYDERLKVDEKVGGTKFVLRSDIMFAVDKAIPVVTVPGPELQIAPPDVTVESIVGTLSNNYHLCCVLEELDLLSVSVKNLLVPGPNNVADMLLDLGVEQGQCETFISECKAITRYTE